MITELFRNANHIYGELKDKILHIEILLEHISIQNGGNLFKAINRLLEETQAEYLILDLSKIEDIHSVGIGHLIHIKSELKNKLYLVNLNSYIYKVLKLIQLDEFFLIFDTMDDAIKYIYENYK